MVFYIHEKVVSIHDLMRKIYVTDIHGVLHVYSGWFKFRGVPIFVVFLDGPIH